MDIWSAVLKYKLDYLSMTDAEICEQLKGVTLKDMLVEEVRNFLFVEGLWFLGADQKLKGVLQSIYTNSGTDSETVNTLDEFAAALYGGGSSTISTHTSLDRSKQVYETLAQLTSGPFSVLTEEQKTAFYSLGGGLAFPDLTEESVTSAREAYELEATLQQELQEVQNAISNHLAVALQGNLHITGLTAGKEFVIASLANTIAELQQN